MMEPIKRVPRQAWVVTLAGVAINLCLGILYAWSVWKARLTTDPLHPKIASAGLPMTGINAGWTYLDDAQATWAYAICGFLFALSMIPGGRLQDKFGPKIGATLGGVFLATGCVVAGLLKSYFGLIFGFGILGGIGMGLSYAAATPAAVKWFGPHRRGLIVGLVVGGYGGAAIYISPLATSLIENYGLSGSFIALGIMFAVVIIAAAQALTPPPAGYVPPAAPVSATPQTAARGADWPASQMLRTWQFYALLFIFFGSAQSGLLVIANAAPILKKTAGAIPFFVSYAWVLASFGGFVNASGRIGTGFYSDRIGRSRAYLINGALSALCLFLTPAVMNMKSVPLLFLVVGVAYWQYGGGLALLPSFTADYFGAKNMGLNYGLVFLGWGLAFFVAQAAGYIKDATGSLDNAFYLSAILLVAAVVVSQFLRRPEALPEETNV